jgi:beta-glucanase (GH16 family)
MTEDFHVFGFEWTRDHLRWYVDGALKAQQPNRHWHHAAIMMFDSEAMPKWFGDVDPGTLPATFSVDHVRAWGRLDGPEDGRTRVEYGPSGAGKRRAAQRPPPALQPGRPAG